MRVAHNPWMLNRRLVNARGEFVHFIHLDQTTKDPNTALMATQEQIDNCLKRYPELRGFAVQEVIKSKGQVLR